MGKKGWILTGICLLFCLLALFDYIRAGMFHITVLSAVPDPSAADGHTPVTVSVQLTDWRGKGVEGHSLYAFPLNGGAFSTNRLITDENGKAEYEYIPYRASESFPLQDVTILIRDESNSVFIEINTKTEYSIRLVRPGQEEQQKIDMDAIYGD